MIRSKVVRNFTSIVKVHLFSKSNFKNFINDIPLNNTDNNGSSDKLGTRKGMVIASLIIDSLLPQVDEIEHLLKSRGTDFLALNETKIDDKLPDNLFKIDGYKFICCDRTRHGGGVAVYCRDMFKSKVREDIPQTSLEIIGIEITPLRAAPLIILSWYRPPSDPIDTFDKLEQVMRFLEL